MPPTTTSTSTSPNQMRRPDGSGSLRSTRLRRCNPRAVVASHKRPENDDNPRIIEQTRQYIRDFDRLADDDDKRSGALREDAGSVSEPGQPWVGALEFGTCCQVRYGSPRELRPPVTRAASENERCRSTNGGQQHDGPRRSSSEGNGRFLTRPGGSAADPGLAAAVPAALHRDARQLGSGGDRSARLRSETSSCSTAPAWGGPPATCQVTIAGMAATRAGLSWRRFTVSGGATLSGARSGGMVALQMVAGPAVDLPADDPRRDRAARRRRHHASRETEPGEARPGPHEPRVRCLEEECSHIVARESGRG